MRAIIYDTEAATAELRSAVEHVAHCEMELDNKLKWVNGEREQALEKYTQARRKADVVYSESRYTAEVARKLARDAAEAIYQTARETAEAACQTAKKAAEAAFKLARDTAEAVRKPAQDVALLAYRAKCAELDKIPSWEQDRLREAKKEATLRRLVCTRAKARELLNEITRA